MKILSVLKLNTPDAKYVFHTDICQAALRARQNYPAPCRRNLFHSYSKKPSPSMACTNLSTYSFEVVGQWYSSL